MISLVKAWYFFVVTSKTMSVHIHWFTKGILYGRGTSVLQWYLINVDHHMVLIFLCSMIMTVILGKGKTVNLLLSIYQNKNFFSSIMKRRCNTTR